MKLPAPWTVRVVLLALGSIAGLLIGELALRAMEAITNPNKVHSGLLVEDPRLGPRLLPYAAGSDARGFRNREALRAAEIVAIGDSQTWGVNAQLTETWPTRLQTMTGRSVYNMSGGGFGMVQYAALFDEALSLNPGTLVIGLYLGNDLYESYRAAYRLTAWAHLRLQDRMDLMVDTIGPRADREWNDEKAFQHAYGRTQPAMWGLWLRSHSSIGRLLERAGAWPGPDAWFEIGKAWARANPESGGYYDDGRVRTVFTVGYRALAVDVQDARIREGLRITQELLAQIRSRAQRSRVELLVVLIPTKERAFFREQTRRSSASDVHSRLARNEDACKSALLDTAMGMNLRTLDLLDPLQAAIEAGRQVYPTNIESHPGPEGYEVIARAIASRLSEG